MTNMDVDVVKDMLFMEENRGSQSFADRITIKVGPMSSLQNVGIRIDTFKIDGKTVRVYEKKRHELLLRTIRECMKPSFDSEISNVVYLYYDGAEVREEMLI